MAQRLPPLDFFPKKTQPEGIRILTDRADLLAWRDALLSDVGERPPGPRHQITLAEVQDYSRRWEENRRREPKVEFDVVTDPDGAPLAIGPAAHVFEFSWLAIDEADADRLCITAGQYPRVAIVRPYSEGDNNR